jgi:hypothetical protein
MNKELNTFVYWNVSFLPVNVASIEWGAVSISQTPAAVHNALQGCSSLYKFNMALVYTEVNIAGHTRIDAPHPFQDHADARPDRDGCRAHMPTGTIACHICVPSETRY